MDNITRNVPTMLGLCCIKLKNYGFCSKGILVYEWVGHLVVYCFGIRAIVWEKIERIREDSEKDRWIWGGGGGGGEAKKDVGGRKRMK